MTTDEDEGVTPCPDCDGTGEAGVNSESALCERCMGNGEIVVDWGLYLRAPQTQTKAEGVEG